MAKKVLTYTDVIKSIERREFVPVYLLMGEESYYIDRISDAIDRHVLTEDEKGFNQVTIYCTKDSDDEANIINSSKRFPMMSEYQVVIVKEAQNLRKIDDLLYYVQNPLNTTILVICYKNGNVDRRKKIVGAIEKVGIVFESPKVRENALPSFIADYVRESGRKLGRTISIDQKATMMMAQFVGCDLNRMAGELDKLIFTLPEEKSKIDPDAVERNIGISKEYNVWELRNAIIRKDVVSANKIMSFLCDNPKVNSPISTIAILFLFFAQLMQYHYSPDKTPQGRAAYMEFRGTWQSQDFDNAARVFSARKTMDIISKLRETDAALKGVRKGGASDADIMKELLFFILH